jgi:hypothetical protein
MTPYGYRDKRSRFVYGPGNFEISSAPEPVTPFYLEPQFEGQKPFGGVVPNIGIFYYYPESIGKLGVEPVYLGVGE